MNRYTLSTVLAILAYSTHVLAQSSSSSPTAAPTASPTASPTAPPATPATPLVDKRFSYPSGIPYQVDTDDLIRGRQYGYNICNSTTEGPRSLCQTAFVNSIDDFCVWAPATPDSTIADTEGEAVAWCTKPGRGTRIIPRGTLKGVQFIQTPAYVSVVGFIEQPLLNIQAGDYGGELDPHGADLRGNPLGGLMYSNAFPSNGGNRNNFQQVIEWHSFIGGSQFCIKVCDPAGADDARYCEHIFDRIGCAYNVPNNAQTGTFQACEGENQDFPGVYTTNGRVTTYAQPPESLGPITTIPYQARVPASSNCVNYQSSQLYTSQPNPSVTTSPSTTGRTAVTGSGPSAAAPAATSARSGAGALVVSSISTLAGVVFAVVLFA